MKYLICFLLFTTFFIQACAKDSFNNQKDSDIYQEAMTGNAEALYELGVRYYKGENTAQDYVKAYALLSLTSAVSDRYVGDMLETIESTLAPKQLKEAEDLYQKLWNKVKKP